jgi:hypothetical protein
LPFPKDDLVRLAFARFEPLKRGRRPAKYRDLRATLGEPFKKADDAKLSRAIASAFQKKFVELVTVKAPPNFLPPATDQKLENALKDAFQLDTAIVVKWPPLDYLTPANSEEADEDLAHALGAAVAKNLAIALRSGDQIGIGAGRACYRTSHEFRHHFAGQKHTDVRIYSLAGNFDVRSKTAREKNVVVDASLNAYRLTNGWLDVACHLEPITAPALIVDSKKFQAYRADTWLGDKNRGRPSYAVVGAGGILSNYGRQLEAAAMSHPDLKKPIDRLKDLCNQSMGHTPPDLPPYQVVADFANRLCVIPPPPGYRADGDRLQEQATPLVKQINRHILAATEEDLLSMNLWLVAGGVAKTLVIYALLTDPGGVFGLPARQHPIKVFCTDGECAEKLLALKAKFAEASSKRPPRLAPAPPGRPGPGLTRRPNAPSTSPRR